MSFLKESLSETVTWCLDGEKETPERFSDSAEEQNNLMENGAWLDFSHGDVVEISGPERVTFLQGLTTNQMKDVSPQRAVHTAMLTPQGRFQWDFTVLDPGDERLLLIGGPGQADELIKLLSFYRMRTKATFQDVTDQYGVMALVGPEATSLTGCCCFPSGAPDPLKGPLPPPLGTVFSLAGGEILWRDPRHTDFGWRLCVHRDDYPARWQQLTQEIPPAGYQAWEAYRLQKALPRGGVDLVPGQNLPLEGGYLDLNSVSFSKGCFVGQETTARTHHRGTLKKRLFQVIVEGGEPMEIGTPVLTASGKEAGILTSLVRQGENCLGLAILRLSDVTPDKPLTASGRPVTARQPDWADWSLADDGS